jgi:hypothetical protein
MRLKHLLKDKNRKTLLSVSCGRTQQANRWRPHRRALLLATAFERQFNEGDQFRAVFEMHCVLLTPAVVGLLCDTHLPDRINTHHSLPNQYVDLAQLASIVLLGTEWRKFYPGN